MAPPLRERLLRAQRITHLQVGFAERVQQLGLATRARVTPDRALDAHPHVGDIRGRGLFWGLELVEDRETHAPFDPKLRMHARVKRAALQAGLMCYPMGGTIDGARGDHVLLAPPFITEDAQLDELVDKLGAALTILEKETT